jgi:hypothetical protein
MLGKGYLCAVVTQDAANWPTPAEQDGKQGGITPFQAKGGNHTNLLHIAAIKSTHGPAAPANPSTDGSRQGLWRTPSVAEEKNQNTSTQIYLQNQVGATPKAWATPQLQDGHNINQDSTTHKTIPAQLTKMNMAGKLNPRWVETLQGVCMGWTSPSCPASVIKNWPKFVSGWCAVTIEPTNYDYSETESCLPQPSELLEF